MKHNIFKTLLWIGLAITVTGCPWTEDNANLPFLDDDAGLDEETDAGTDAAPPTGPLDLGEKLIYEHTGSLSNLACWGDHVAWALFGETGATIVIMDANGNTREIPADIYGNHSLVLSSEFIAWENIDFASTVVTRTDVFYSPVTGTAGSPHMQSEYDETDPRIDGNNVAWLQYNDTYPVLHVGTFGSSTVQDLGMIAESKFDISGDKVALSADWSSVTVKDLAGGADIEMDGPIWAIRLRISGDYIVYYELMDFGNGANVVLQSIETQEATLIAYHLGADPIGLDIDGNYVAYAGTTTEQGVEVTAVYLYDIAQNTVRQVATGYDRIWDVALGGGRIAWLVGDKYGSSDPSIDSWKIYSALLP
jgi:hypothetical protein